MNYHILSYNMIKHGWEMPEQHVLKKKIIEVNDGEFSIDIRLIARV